MKIFKALTDLNITFEKLKEETNFTIWERGK